MADGITRTIPAHTSISLDLGTLEASEHLLATVRQAMESELARRGVAVVRKPNAGLDVRMTLARGLRGLLLIAEIPTPGTRSVIIALLSEESSATGRPQPAKKVELSAQLLIERNEPILDALIMEQEILVLGPAKVSVYTRDGLSRGSKEIPIEPVGTMPRDPRGRILADQAGAITLLLPRSRCTGTTAQGFACFPSEELWPLTQDGRLRARIVPGRNHFEAASVDLRPPEPIRSFFSAVRVGEGPGAILMVEGTEGSTRIYDAALLEKGASSLFGTHLTQIASQCGPIFLQVREEETESLLEVIEVKDQQPVPIGDPVRFQTVTAIWPSAGTKAVVVCRNNASGRFALYLVEIACAEVPDAAAQ